MSAARWQVWGKSVDEKCPTDWNTEAYPKPLTVEEATKLVADLMQRETEWHHDMQWCAVPVGLTPHSWRPTVSAS